MSHRRGTNSDEELKLSCFYLRMAGEYWYRAARPWLPEPALAPADLGPPDEEFLRFRRNQRPILDCWPFN